MILKKILLTAMVGLMSIPVSAQDLLARQAPVDRRMRAIDSISLHRILPDYRMETSGMSLYPEWNNEHGRNYGVSMPSEFKIDLRHFCMPCESRLVTSHYGYRSSFGRNHYGTDIKVYVGDTIRAAFTGKIRIVAYDRRGYGNYVIIRHDNGLETVYGHMSKHLVRENQDVRAGEPIGLGGNTGRSTGSHLHFETRFLGECIDPEVLFNFEAQDALADFYVYRSNGNHTLIGGTHHADAPVHMASPATVTANAVGVLAANDNVAATEAMVIEVPALDKKAQAREKKETIRKKVHSVKQGDTLSGIARKYHTTVDKLCKLNRIKKTSTLRLGQILRYS